MCILIVYAFGSRDYLTKTDSTDPVLNKIQELGLSKISVYQSKYACSTKYNLILNKITREMPTLIIGENIRSTIHTDLHVVI